MNKYLLLSLGVLAACSGDVASPTKNLPTAPANLPPADYYLNEFTDNRGCNYIRPSAGGRWVPQVNLDGSQICGGVPAQRFNTGAGIDDPFGSLTAGARASGQEEVASNRGIGGIRIGTIISGGNPEAAAQITGTPTYASSGRTVPLDDTPASPPATPSPQQPEVKPQQAPQPAPQVQPRPEPTPVAQQPQEPQPAVRQPAAPQPQPAQSGSQYSRVVGPRTIAPYQQVQSGR